MVIYRACRGSVASALVAMTLLASSGCSDAKTPSKKTMRLDEVPAAFMETARKELPGVDFSEAWVKKDGTLEIRGKAKNGKVREIDIRPDGTVEEVE